MLFWVKLELRRSLAALALLAGAAAALHFWLRLRWDLQPSLESLGAALAGAAAILASDALLHGLLYFGMPRRYRPRYRSLAAYFRRQGTPEILASGAVAGAEELFFRGAILEGLKSAAGAPAWLALALSSAAFGASHWLPGRRLGMFALWSIWEGMLIGGIYLWSGSLAAAILAHAAHDIIGFALFARQRKTGWMAGGPDPGDAPGSLS